MGTGSSLLQQRRDITVRLGALCQGTTLVANVNKDMGFGICVENLSLKIRDSHRLFELMSSFGSSFLHKKRFCTERAPQGLKPNSFPFVTARLKSCLIQNTRVAPARDLRDPQSSRNRGRLGERMVLPQTPC